MDDNSDKIANRPALHFRHQKSRGSEREWSEWIRSPLSAQNNVEIDRVHVERRRVESETDHRNRQIKVEEKQIDLNTRRLELKTGGSVTKKSDLL